MDQPNAEADWNQYFKAIKSVCPWSYTAWHNNRILIMPWQGEVKELGTNHAQIYVTDLAPKALAKLANEYNQLDDDCEWLWSHPKGGGANSTPVPCLIQQSRLALEKLRSMINTSLN